VSEEESCEDEEHCGNTDKELENMQTAAEEGKSNPLCAPLTTVTHKHMLRISIARESDWRRGNKFNTKSSRQTGASLVDPQILHQHPVDIDLAPGLIAVVRGGHKVL
jgi:hypothetical protein